MSFLLLIIFAGTQKTNIFVSLGAKPLVSTKWKRTVLRNLRYWYTYTSQQLYKQPIIEMSKKHVSKTQSSCTVSYPDQSHHIFDKTVNFRTLQSSRFTLNRKERTRKQRKKIWPKEKEREREDVKKEIQITLSNSHSTHIIQW